MPERWEDKILRQSACEHPVMEFVRRFSCWTYFRCTACGWTQEKYT